jgi:transposase
MRLCISRSKNSASLYVTKSIYENGNRSTKVVEKLGTYDELKKKLDKQDPIEWAKRYIAELNKKEKEDKKEIIVKYSPSKIIDKDIQNYFNAGYLFLQKIYHELKLNKLCEEISLKYKFTFNLDSVLSRLIYARIIYPSSKLTTFQLSNRFIEQPDFELQHIYRALEVIAKESDFIQSFLYKNSLKITKRNTGVLYYDCTNYFFEIEQEEGLKQYGVSKEHKPNPIVQMGLFMDKDGIPLAFVINKGNTNEQLTLRPLEEKILSDFKLSKFVVCTDAGLASDSNRKFNTKGERAFITTQSIKKLKIHLKEWALNPDGWSAIGEKTKYNIAELDRYDDDDRDRNKYKDKHRDKIFYKERWIKEKGLEQRLIVTYSIKYRDYQRSIRNSQIERAQKVVDFNPKKIEKCNPNDYKRFIEKKLLTEVEEKAVKHKIHYSINTDLISKESQFDGFYAVCTNLEDDVSSIIDVNRRRWEIEECFRIMKSEFKARPVYLSRDDRIIAHFTTCFISLVIHRLIEKKLEGKYTCHEIIKGLRDLNLLKVRGEGYMPAYTRTSFTDSIHKAFGFRTDYQIVSNREMRKIFKLTKS